jgi:hypothetical protein
VPSGNQHHHEGLSNAEGAYSYNGNGVESLNGGDDLDDDVDIEVQLMRSRLSEME